MNAVKVDAERRVQLSILRPGDLYEPEIRSADEIRLHRVQPRQRPSKLTRDEVLQALEASPLSFHGSWDQLREETRG